MGIFGGLLNIFRKEESSEQQQSAHIKKLESSIDPPDFVPMQLYPRQKYQSKIKNTVYYVCGHVSQIVPPPIGSYYDNRDIIYSATSIVSDGVHYDLTDLNSILSMKIPNYLAAKKTKISEELGVTGCLEYVLRSRAGQFYNEEEFDLAIACLGKATVFMRHSVDVMRSQNDYYRIVNWLLQLGRFKKAKEWKNWIEAGVPSAEDVDDKIWTQTIQTCKSLRTDLVEVGEVRSCCEKCAMYRKRVYSLSGKDKRFPKFPSDFHQGCGLDVWPFIYGLDRTNFRCKDIVAYSNRPFVDDRTPEELKNREERLKKIAAKNPIYPVSIDKITYYWLKQLFPNDVPKSLSAFSRAKNANTAKYQALVKKAEDAGFVFPKSLEDVAKWEDHPPVVQ